MACCGLVQWWEYIKRVRKVQIGCRKNVTKVHPTSKLA